jgi:predicted DNA-binding transcriptional regulator YafY
MQHLVEPLGLVAKAGIWYLVYQRQERVRVIRLSELHSVQTSVERFIRPADFDLAFFWEHWCTEVEALSAQFKATVRLSRISIPELARYFGKSVLAQDEGIKRGEDAEWIELELAFESFEEARQRLLGLGLAVEVLAPLPLRASVLDYAEQIVDLYDR